MSKKPWCAVPFIHMYASDPKWDDKVCCVATKKVNTHEHNQDNWLEEKWTGEYMVDLRKRMFDKNAELPECRECIENEKVGGSSDRLSYWNYIDQPHNNIELEYNVDTGNQFGTPIDFDLRPGNLCNLACRMCGPASSSQLNKELNNNPVLRELEDGPGSWKQKISVVDGNTWSSENNLKYIEKSLKNTKRIKFLGGEPTLMPDVKRIIDFMNNNGIDKNLNYLHFTTNGTNLNKNFYDSVKNYPTVDINLSIDGINETVEYIRYPVNFEKFKENYFKVRELPNVQTVLNCAVQALNLHNMIDFTTWAVETMKQFGELNFVLVTGPMYSSPAALPKEWRQRWCSRILNHEIMKHQIVKDSRLEQMILRIQEMETKNYSEFIKQTVIMDRIRNQHLKNVIPGLWEIVADDYKTFQRDLLLDKNESKMRSDWWVGNGRY